MHGNNQNPVSLIDMMAKLLIELNFTDEVKEVGYEEGSFHEKPDFEVANDIMRLYNESLYSVAIPEHLRSHRDDIEDIFADNFAETVEKKMGGYGAKEANIKEMLNKVKEIESDLQNSSLLEGYLVDVIKKETGYDDQMMEDLFGFTPNSLLHSAMEDSGQNPADSLYAFSETINKESRYNLKDEFNKIKDTDLSIRNLQMNVENTNRGDTGEPMKLNRDRKYLYAYVYNQAVQRGIPFPGIVAAQASLESSHGTSELARETNNLFGIKKWKDNQQSKNFATKEDYGGEKQVSEKSDFVVYNSIGDSLDGYIDFIQNNPRQASALEAKTSEEYAQKLQDNTYATDENYAKKIIKIRNDYLPTAQEYLTKPQEERTFFQEDTLQRNGQTKEIIKGLEGIGSFGHTIDNLLDMYYTPQRVKTQKAINDTLRGNR